MKQKLDLLFTRDIALFTSQFFNDHLMSKIIKKSWGVALEDQIIHFDGRTVEIYRIHDDAEHMKKHMVGLPLSHKLYTAKFRTDFKKAANDLRKLISSKPKNLKTFLKSCLQSWSDMYPGYMLSNFLPGPWADDFRKVHGKEGEKYLKIKFDDRVFVEGLFEKTDIFLRSIASKELEKHHIPGHYENVLTFTEFKDLLKKGKAPKISDLKNRKKGWTLIKWKLEVGKPFKQLLDKNNYSFEFQKIEAVKEFKGQIGYKANSVTGKVKLVFNQNDVREFPEGAVLVAAMTSPEHLHAMKRSVAIVTDEGGITCHAAIVSRELKIPCVIGTKVATKVLKDGDLVEVDANKGTVRKLK